MDEDVVIRNIKKIDHVTHAVRFENERAFIQKWLSREFQETMRFQTTLYPATHIALMRVAPGQRGGRIMVGLSISDDPQSPVNRFIELYGEGPQHTAYDIHPGVDFNEMYKMMIARGQKFMTPVLTYGDAGGSRLNQAFTAPTKPYGRFTEYIQRLPDKEGRIFDSFDVGNIEDLYALYDDYSKFLLKEQSYIGLSRHPNL